MVGLSANGLGRRLFKGSILLQRFVEGFDVPPFAVDSRDLVASEVGLTAHQILNAATAIFVCEDLLDQRQWEIDPFEVNLLHDIRFQCQTVQPHITTLLFIFNTQSNFAIGFEWHNEIRLQVVFDEHHIVRRGIPDIV